LVPGVLARPLVKVMAKMPPAGTEHVDETQLRITAPVPLVEAVTPRHGDGLEMLKVRLAVLGVKSSGVGISSTTLPVVLPLARMPSVVKVTANEVGVLSTADPHCRLPSQVQSRTAIVRSTSLGIKAQTKG